MRSANYQTGQLQIEVSELQIYHMLCDSLQKQTIAMQLRPTYKEFVRTQI